jgi:RNA polymerase sigma-54 factor
MLRHHISQELRPQATAHLAQTMAFLQLNTTELENTLMNELNQNPALELVEELRCPTCGKRISSHPCPSCARPTDDGSPVIYLSTRQSFGTRDGAAEEDRADSYEAHTRESLEEFILKQIAADLTREERPIAAYILLQLDDDGLLQEEPVEIAAYLRAPLATVERVLSLIQHADPVGVGARSPIDSLLIQIEALKGAVSENLRNLARAIIVDAFDLLARNDLRQIARQLRSPLSTVEMAARFIQRNLTPYPGRAYWGDGKTPSEDLPAYHEADVNITMQRRGSETPSTLMVEIFTPLAGTLRVNPTLRAAMQELTDQDAGKQEKWAQAVERATLITKCVQQRNHTMRRLMEILVNHQKDFILNGDGSLKPLTRSVVAKLLSVHESTISRAVASKTIALPSGRIVPLSKFFDRSLSVRDRVRQIIEAETRPMTDDEIADALSRDGIDVARRTVAKYCNMLGILPANLRQRPSAVPAMA